MAEDDKKNANKERTFLMLKPDAVHRGLIADIIKRFEQKGFKLVAMKFMKVQFIRVTNMFLLPWNHFMDFTNGTLIVALCLKRQVKSSLKNIMKS